MRAQFLPTERSGVVRETVIAPNQMVIRPSAPKNNMFIVVYVWLIRLLLHWQNFSGVDPDHLIRDGFVDGAKPVRHTGGNEDDVALIYATGVTVPDTAASVPFPTSFRSGSPRKAALDSRAFRQ